LYDYARCVGSDFEGLRPIGCRKNFGSMPLPPVQVLKRYGTLIGAIIIGILDKGLNQAGVQFSLQHVTKSLVILGAVYLDVRRR
jgi:hypothetical protein